MTAPLRLLEDDDARPAPVVEPIAFGVKDAAQALGVGTTLLRALLRQGEIRAFHLGDRLLIARSELLRLVEERMAAEAQQ